jgi:hypothetical protein
LLGEPVQAGNRVLQTYQRTNTQVPQPKIIAARKIGAQYTAA